MAELIAGAVLGTLTSELYTLVENLIKNSKQFNPLLEDIKATLESLKPLIEEIEDKNKELNLSNVDIEKFKDRISVGITILRECSQDPKWYRKVTYTKKLNDLDESLKRQLAILMAHGVRDGKETLGLARKHATQLTESGKEITSAVKEVDTGVQMLWVYWWVLVALVRILMVFFNLALKIILVVVILTYIARSLVLPSGQTLPFKGSTGTFIVVTLGVAKFITRLLVFIGGLGFLLHSIQGTYKKGFYRWKLRDFLWLGGCTAWFLYGCLVFLTPLGCKL